MNPATRENVTTSPSMKLRKKASGLAKLLPELGGISKPLKQQAGLGQSPAAVSARYKATTPSTAPQLTVQLLPGVAGITQHAAPSAAPQPRGGRGAKQLSPAARPSSPIWHRRHILNWFCQLTGSIYRSKSARYKQRAISECMIHGFLTHNNLKNIELHTGLKQIVCSVFVLSKKSPHCTNQWDSNVVVLPNRNQDENVLICAHL